jgi:hypothetical protein
LGAIFEDINRNIIASMDKYMKVLFLTIVILTSCKTQVKKTVAPEVISNYKVQVTFSSFFDCGDYKKILIDNKWESDPVYKNKIKDLHLYIFDIENNCHDQVRIDTQSISLSTLQSDSIFKLANYYVNNFSIYNPKASGMKTIVMDGSDIKVEVCYENKCKSVTIYHYDKLPSDFINLESFIDSIK